MKKYKPYIIALAVIIIIVIIYFIWQSSTAAKTAPVTPKPESKSDTLLSIFNNLFGKGHAKNYYCKIFPKSCYKKYCDCSYPGFSADGVQDSLCNEDGIQFERDCK